MKDDFTVNNIIKIAKLFLPTEKVLDLSPLGNGHINTTYLVTTNKAKYTLQMINTRIFTDVEGLMSNIDKVTNFLRSKASQKGKDPSRVTLEFLDTIEGKKYAILEDHAYRMYKYIDGQIRRIDRELADQRVFNATTSATVSCLTGQVNGMQALLNSITKTVVPNSAICPGWGDVTVSITPATTPAAGA
jgi:hypothetical protein